MLIRYHPNPLCTAVELDERNIENLRLKTIIENLEIRVYGAHYYLGKGDTDAAVAELDVESLEDSPLNKHIGEWLEIHIRSLQGEHFGDCTCVPSSCFKCHAERLLGINTIAYLGKHQAHKIVLAFANGRTLDDAISWLSDYKPKRDGAWLRYPEESFNQHVPGWIVEASGAAEWLRGYRQKHFSEPG